MIHDSYTQFSSMMVTLLDLTNISSNLKNILSPVYLKFTAQKMIHLRKLMVCEWNLRKYFLPSASKVYHNMYIKMPTSCMTSFKNFNLLYKCDDTTMPRSVARSTKLPQEKNFMVETI